MFISLHALMEWCRVEGITVFDFSLGEEPYKLAWADGTLELYHHLHALTARGLPYLAWARMHALGCRLLRQFPVLQSAKTRLSKALIH